MTMTKNGRGPRTQENALSKTIVARHSNFVDELRASSSSGPVASVNYTRADGRLADPAELGAAFSKCQLETAQNPTAMNACMSREG
jgi:hypothetical protein